MTLRRVLRFSTTLSAVTLVAASFGGRAAWAQSDERRGQLDMGEALGRIHQLNEIQITWAEVGLENGSILPVRDFAKKLARDHQKNDEKLMTLAKKKNLTISPPAQELPSNLKWRAQLEAAKVLKGADFDRRYLSDLVTMHKQALTDVNNYRVQSRDKDLNKFLDQTRDQLSKHLTEAQDLQSKRAPAAARRTPRE
ncbi:MAG: DUF4142 domain-containing protein [Myxococcaceae bacterium]